MLLFFLACTFNAPQAIDNTPRYEICPSDADPECIKNGSEGSLSRYVLCPNKESDYCPTQKVGWGRIANNMPRSIARDYPSCADLGRRDKEWAPPSSRDAELWDEYCAFLVIRYDNNP